MSHSLSLPKFWIFVVAALCMTSVFFAKSYGYAVDSEQAETIKSAMDTASRGNPFFRGLLLPILHGTFMLIAICFGLWCYKMTAKMQTLWALPAAWLVGTTLAAVICNFVIKGGWNPFEDSILKMIAPSLSPYDALAMSFAVFFGLLIVRGILMAPLWGILVTLLSGSYAGIVFTALYSDPHHNLMYAVGSGLSFAVVGVIGIGVGHIFDGAKLEWIPKTLGYLSIFSAFLTLIQIS